MNKYTLARRLAALGVAASLLPLAGCRSAVVTTRTDAGNAPTQVSSGTPAAARGAGGPGIVTVSITQPVTVSGHAGSSVTCDTGRIYTAVAQGAPVDGYQLSFTVRIAAYHGAGTYPALVTLRLDGSTGAVTTVSAVPDIPATVSSSGGSFTLNATGDNGRTLAASLQWTCG